MTGINSLHEFLRTRRSVRRFKPDPVPDSVIERLLTTASYAPSAHHRQPWRFVVVTAAAKARLADAMSVDFQRDLTKDGVAPEEISRQVARSKSRIQAAPVVVVVCMDTKQLDEYPDALRRQAERTMAIQSVAAAGLQLLLAAHAEGLGGVWVCSPLFAPRAARKALRIQNSWDPQGMCFVGYPEVIPAARERKPLEEITVVQPLKTSSNEKDRD
jgi:coenzyme F420-0:L-glutamate ligase/coenzyme F420-1:gamma-L-glutamate ligase